jgi:voltage-gated potassium channel
VVFDSRPVLRQTLTPLLAFGAVTVTSMAGYAVLADVGPVDAVFWLIDPTSVELHFRSHAGPERVTKLFTIAVRLGLVLSGLWIGETALTAVFGGQISDGLKRMQQERAIDDLSDHVIICGYGIFGRTLTDRLRDSGREVVAIELDPGEFEQIPEDLLASQGDATQEQVLQDAGITDSTAIVAAIDDSNANIQIAITASQLAPDVTVIVRVGDQQYDTVARRAGADEVVIPEVLTGESVSDWLQD